MPKEHRKIQYTKKVIREAFVKLLQDKPIEKIRISELCELADIHRGTFYQHYQDIYDLQDSIRQELLEKFASLKTTTPDLSAGLVQTILDETELCKVLLGQNPDHQFLETIIAVCREGSYQKYQSIGIPCELWEPLYLYCTHGSLSLIRSWVIQGFNQSSEELLTQVSLFNKRFLEQFSS